MRIFLMNTLPVGTSPWSKRWLHAQLVHGRKSQDTADLVAVDASAKWLTKSLLAEPTVVVRGVSKQREITQRRDEATTARALGKCWSTSNMGLQGTMFSFQTRKEAFELFWNVVSSSHQHVRAQKTVFSYLIPAFSVTCIADIFRHPSFGMRSKQDGSKSTNHSPLTWPFELMADLHRSDMKHTLACIGCVSLGSPPRIALLTAGYKGLFSGMWKK